MPPEQQTQISTDGATRRESLTSRRESILSRRESLGGSRRGSLIASEISPGEGKIPENETVPEEGQIAENEPEIPPEPEPEPLSPEEEKRLREEEEQQRKKIAIEMRKAELRAKMEEASMARRAKKGFMTPERKKKLRLLLRKKAAEELRKEQERKANERRWIIEERCGEPEDLEWASKDDLIDICEDYFQRIFEIESDKWDLEYEIRKQTLEITELTQKVSDLRGKFQKPILKKVSKYENKFAKLQRKAAEYNFRSQLKIVRRPDYKPPKEDDKKGHVEKAAEEAEKTEKAEETEEAKDEAAEGAERTSLTEEERVATPKPEGEVVVEIVEGEAEVEGRVESTGESRLEGEPGESAVVPEGELGEGGQSPDDQGEVQPAELSESTEPPPPPPPQHSPDDLWEYLKDAVTGEHPATVEEFVQKLIGTLEHVPEEYLKPVIDYNIKRAVSPSVTDGEHLEARDGEQHPEGVEQSESGEVPSQENGEVGLEGHSTPLAEDANPDGVLPEEHAVTHEDATYIPEDPSEEAPIPAEGYTALEATT